MLARAAIRICAVQAIMDRTFAGDRVLDSEIGNIDDLGAERRPFIAVYTDDDSSREGLTLVFEIGVTARMVSIDPETNEPVEETGVPQTDGEMELVLDAIQRQIHVALAEPGNDWGDLYRRLFGKPQVSSLRGADAKDGLRFAARQIKLTGTPQPDPPFNLVLAEDSVWRVFLDLISAAPDAALAAKRPLFEALLGSGSAPADWRTLYRLLGLADLHAEALGRTLADATWPSEITSVIDHPHGMADEQPGGLA